MERFRTVFAPNSKRHVWKCQVIRCMQISIERFSNECRKTNIPQYGPEQVRLVSGLLYGF